MRSSAHIKGHPVHPMLISFPIAFFVGSACLDFWSRATGRPTFNRTAAHMNTLGLGTAVLAAVPGLMDYAVILPPNSSAKDRATKHMLANLSVMGLFIVARAARGNPGAPPPVITVAAEIVGTGLLAVAGWLGGTLVFRNQIGVDHRYANAGKLQVEAVPGRAPREGPVDVGADDELEPGQMKLLRIGGKRIVLARTERGHAAFDDRCTHKGGPLADGALVCGTVQCPWHGSQFDVDTGAVTAGPAVVPIETYDVSTRDGRVWLRVP